MIELRETDSKAIISHIVLFYNPNDFGMYWGVVFLNDLFTFFHHFDVNEKSNWSDDIRQLVKVTN